MKVTIGVPDEIAHSIGEDADSALVDAMLEEHVGSTYQKGLIVRNYIQNACRTESQDPQSGVRVLRVMRLLHGGMGMATEAGELLDNLKKHIFYGKPLDEVNIMEEIGDSFWYSAIILDVLGYNWEDVMRRNIDKLRARFPDKFDSVKALNRDLEKERQILESEHGSS